MESYHGHISTVADALKLIEAARYGIVPLIKRRLNGNERVCIRSGTVFVFDASVSGVQRWTDGLRWSASRLSGHFLVYNQKEFVTSSHFNEGYNKLIKKALTVVTTDNRRFGLISYFTNYDVDSGLLKTPSTDSSLASIEIPLNYYFRKVTQLSSASPTSYMLTPLNGREDELISFVLPHEQIRNDPPNSLPNPSSKTNSSPIIYYASSPPKSSTQFPPIQSSQSMNYNSLNRGHSRIKSLPLPSFHETTGQYLSNLTSSSIVSTTLPCIQALTTLPLINNSSNTNRIYSSEDQRQLNSFSFSF